jgi:hypothetical protein
MPGFCLSRARVFAFLGAVVAPVLLVLFVSPQEAQATFTNHCRHVILSEEIHPPPGCPSQNCCVVGDYICWCPGYPNSQCEEWQDDGKGLYVTPCCKYFISGPFGYPHFCGNCTHTCQSP